MINNFKTLVFKNTKHHHRYARIEHIGNDYVLCESALPEILSDDANFNNIKDYYKINLDETELIAITIIENTNNEIKNNYTTPQKRVTRRDKSIMAEVYYQHHTASCGLIEMLIDSKTINQFRGDLFGFEPTEKQYKKAHKWCDKVIEKQLKFAK